MAGTVNQNANTNNSFDPGTLQNGGTPDANAQNQQAQTPEQIEDFQAWLDTQSPELKAAYEKHTTGLRSALQNERQERGKFERDLRAAAKKLEEGSEAQKIVLKQADDIAALEKQNDFFDAAHEAGATNLKLAWLAATDADLIDSKGRCNFEELKKLHPELFASKRPAANVNAGAGGGGEGGNTQTKPASMNDFIRRSAGRG